jgi:diguanylate cyclase (GGDEF)-like protein
MIALDFQSVVALGAGISALFTIASLRLTPALGGNRVTRWLAVGNLSFTAMLGTRLLLGDPPSNAGYAALWSLLITASAMHLFAIRELSAPGHNRPASWHAGFAVLLGVLAFVLWFSPVPQHGAIVTAAGTLAIYGAATRAARRIEGAHLRLPRRTLVVAFGLGAVFTAMHLAQRIAAQLEGIEAVPATAYTYFGATLLFCTTNLGFMLLLYLELAARVNRLAQIDELTGALNRRGFAEHLGRLRDEVRGGPEGALLLIDIDWFKSVNDSHGHAVGDEVLRWFADTLRRFMRRDDLLMRMGGEEFCLLLPGSSDAHGAQVAERIRVEFETHCVAPTSAGPLRITASFGLARFGPGDPRLDAGLRRADAALYAAKRGGRNRVVCWGPELAAASGAAA